MKNLIDAAVRAGVGHVIYTSFSANLDLDFPLGRAKRAVEAHLIASGMAYTILRPSCFMEVWLSPAVGFDPGPVGSCDAAVQKRRLPVQLAGVSPAFGYLSSGATSPPSTHWWAIFPASSKR